MSDFYFLLFILFSFSLSFLGFAVFFQWKLSIGHWQAFEFDIKSSMSIIENSMPQKRNHGNAIEILRSKCDARMYDGTNSEHYKMALSNLRFTHDMHAQVIERIRMHALKSRRSKSKDPCFLSMGVHASCSDPVLLVPCISIACMHAASICLGYLNQRPHAIKNAVRQLTLKLVHSLYINQPLGL